jgi:hypothetical protein
MIVKHMKHKGLSEDGVLELMEKSDDDVVVEKGIDTTIEGKILAMTKGEILTHNTKPIFDLTPDSTPEEIEACIEGRLQIMPDDRVQAAAELMLARQAIDASRPVIEKLKKQKEIILNKIHSKQDNQEPEEAATSDPENGSESNQ